MAIKDKLAGAQRKLKTYAARAGQNRVRESDSGPTCQCADRPVSAAIPVFNAMPYLKERLESLRRRTWTRRCLRWRRWTTVDR